jgi:hypothetical protein
MLAVMIPGPMTVRNSIAFFQKALILSPLALAFTRHDDVDNIVNRNNADTDTLIVHNRDGDKIVFEISSATTISSVSGVTVRSLVSIDVRQQCVRIGQDQFPQRQNADQFLKRNRPQTDNRQDQPLPHLF